PLADPDVFNRYAARHPRALFLEEGVELSPLSDVLVYGGARITSDPAFSLRHPDHGSSFVSARTAIGRLTLSAGFRWNWFLAGGDRAHGLVSRTADLQLLHTIWLGHTQALLLGVTAED